jgi:hypothetical protein
MDEKARGLAQQRLEHRRLVPAECRRLPPVSLLAQTPKGFATALPGRFIELTVDPGRSALRLECNGVYLHVDRGFDPGLLSDILTLLKKV